MERVILHSDLNCFYASVECLYRPDLAGRPVAVSGDPALRHGIILTANYIAKGRGVKTGEAIWQARQKCPDLVTLPPDFKKYLRFSRMARRIYGDYTDQVEPFGIDEAWLDVTGSTGLFGSGEQIACEISRRIKAELGITVSIGVSFNKVFAKLGSDYKKPDGITCITRENFKSLVWPLPARCLLFVGRSTGARLDRLGIATIGQIACADPALLGRQMGKWGELLWSFANGRCSDPVRPCGEEAVIKSISNSSTTPRDLTCDQDARMMLTILADSVAARTRQQGFRGQVVGIWVRDDQLVGFTRQKKLPCPTCLTDEVADTAMELFCSSWHWQRPVRSVGVSLSEFYGGGLPVQLDLGKRREACSLERLERAVDGWRCGLAGCVAPGVALRETALRP